MKTNNLIGSLFLAALIFTACSKKDDQQIEPPVEETVQDGRFVVTALPYMSYIFGNGADLLYTTNTLDSGTLVTTGTGLEQDGVNRNYVIANNKFFSLLFGQGNPGSVTAYTMDTNAQLKKISNFQTETMTAFGAVGEDILMIKNAWEPTQSISNWYRVNTNSLEIVSQGQINTNTLSGNGEMALFTSVKQVGDKVFLPFVSIKTARSFATSYRDSSWIAVYSYPDMTFEKVIRDNRTGAVGAYFTDAIEVDEQGDVYAIGMSLGTDNGSSNGQKSTKPVGIMKIAKGTTDYDNSYFFNISNISDNNYVFRKLYLGKGNFLLMMSDTHNTYANNAKKFAIANVYTQSFKWVTGTPDPATILGITEYSGNYSPKDGKTGYVGIITYTDEGFVSQVFKFDAETATAKVGLTVEGQNIIRSINWVPVSE
ncbi:DUF4374 domain-containing protein [Sphingobacterium sp. LRF_L2]|uniref:DUF4374 domain-containing protein n=1 Tax=Sphingobacterium sp. LRF_L2 TaxID=3369421 RepID=UPI003F6162FB